MRLRHQLAAYSPIPPAAVPAALGAALHLGGDPRVQLRTLLQREYDADEVLLCGSGTQALQLAIGLLRRELKADAPVALPAFNCFDVVSAALGAGGPIAFYDIDPDTLGPDEASLERVLADGARIVVLAPLYGVPLDWNSLQSLAARYGAQLIEDAAQGHGGSWMGRPLGSLGAVSTISFGRGKGWTGGHGGALLARRGVALESLRLDAADAGDELRTTAGLLAQQVLGRPGVYGIPRSIPALKLGETTFRPPLAPRQISRAAAAAVLRTCGASSAEAKVRHANAATLLRMLAGAQNVLAIRAPAAGTPGYVRLPVRLSGGMEMPDRAEALGVTRSYPMILPRLPEAARQMTGRTDDWPGAERLVQELVTLPTHSLLNESEREELVAILRRAKYHATRNANRAFVNDPRRG